MHAVWVDGSKTSMVRYRAINPWSKPRTLFKVKNSLSGPREVAFAEVKKRRLVVYLGSGGGSGGGVRAHWTK